MNLHVLHDFGDDPRKLIEAAAKLDRPPSELPRKLASALEDLGDVIAVGEDESAAESGTVHGPMTVNALAVIIQHLSGVPGRKNLVWLMEDPRRVPLTVMAMAQQANVVVYPVLVRLVGSSFGADASCSGANMHLTEDLAAITGGRAFFDVLDLGFALRATEEDTETSYVLGYYPTEDMLDGKYHKITVRIHNTDPDKRPFELHYRPGYLATRVAPRAPAPTLVALLNNPFEAGGIGLTGEALPEAEHPGLYDVHLTADLHDIHLDHKDGHFIGELKVFLLNPSARSSVNTGTVGIDLKDDQLTGALENGLPILISGTESVSGGIQVVVRDPASGIAGSLRILVGKPAAD